MTSVDFGSTSITVTDSNSGDSVQISRIDPDAIGREVRYWCRAQRYCHNAATRETAREHLQAILESCKDSLQYLAEEEAKEAETAA